jgi:hypothetical protein
MSKKNLGQIKYVRALVVLLPLGPWLAKSMCLSALAVGSGCGLRGVFFFLSSKSRSPAARTPDPGLVAG